MSDQLTNVFALANNITTANAYFDSVQNNSSSIDLANNEYNGGTDITFGLNSLYSTLKNLKAGGVTVTPGNGLTPQTAVGVVMLVTDGVQDSDEKTVYSGGQYQDESDPNFTVLSPCNQSSCWDDPTFGVYFQSLDPSKCTQIKNLGYTLMTLDVNYLVPPVSMQDAAAYEGVFSYIQQYLLQSIPSNMASCATSSSYAFTATSSMDLQTATQNMFAAIPQQQSARISQ